MKTVLAGIGIALMLFSCNPTEEVITHSPDVMLTVSADTILFDTLLTQRLSLTKRFRIFNPSENAVSISNIRLGLLSESNYRIFVNGKEGPVVRDEVLNGRDSLLVLVDADIDPEDADLPYLVKDSVVIEWNTNSTDVKLVSWGQDAHFITQNTVCDVVWESVRPYVIYDSLFVPPNCQLTIKAGVRLLFNNDAALHVAGSLIVQGDSGANVVFRNVRYDRNYLEAPGQWGHPTLGAGIIFYPQSRANEISYAIIENANTGIYMGVPDEDDAFDLTINNTIIRHMTRFGILAFTSDVYAANTLIYNCGSGLVANLAGGTYRYEHCTFSNHPNFFASDEPALYFTDNISNGGETILEDLNIQVDNSIIWGSNNKELFISGGDAQLNLSLNSNIIRYDETIAENYTSIQHNFPGFADPLMFDYSLDSTAFAIDKGTVSEILIDLQGKSRDTNPDIGAFEF